MTYYKVSINGNIESCGSYNGDLNSPVAEIVTEDEYNEILIAFHNKPPRTETTDYRLREDLTWEEYPVDPPDPDPEIDDMELLDILMGGAE